MKIISPFYQPKEKVLHNYPLAINKCSHHAILVLENKNEKKRRSFKLSLKKSLSVVLSGSMRGNYCPMAAWSLCL